VMTGLDFLGALQRNNIDLPIRVFVGETVPNYYRPNALSFCNLSIDEDEEITPEAVAFLCGKHVSIVHSEPTSRVRELAKVLVSVEPQCLVVAAGNVFTSWSHGRGWK